MVEGGRAALLAGRQQSLGDVVYNQVLALILGGDLPTNARLPSESVLAERFGVSRPIVRQALAKLREEHLIASRQGSGSFVQYAPRGAELPSAGGGELRQRISFLPVSNVADLRRYSDFRIGVEGEAATAAALNRSDEQLDALRASVTALEQLADTEDFGVEQDYAFHLKVAEASDNYFIVAVVQALREPIVTAMTLVRILSVEQRGQRLRAAAARHQEIVAAIEARSADDARRLMRLHLEYAKQRVLPARHRRPARGGRRLSGSDAKGEIGFAGQLDAEGGIGLAAAHHGAVARRMRDRRGDLLCRRDRHLPGVDEVDLVVAVRRQAGRPDHRLVLAEIDVADVAVARRRRRGSTASSSVPPIGVEAVAARPPRAGRAGSRCASRPRRAACRPWPTRCRSSGCGVGLAVAGVAAAHHRDPEAVHQFLRR